MTPEEIQASIVLITSTDSQNSRFGTGFVISSRDGTVHLLTCAHVIRDVGGSEKVAVEGKTALVLATGEEEGLDLAVLRIEGLGGKVELKLGEGIEPKSEFLTAGFQLFGKGKLLKSVEGRIESPVELMSQKFSERIKAWELSLEGDSGLQPGYSGAPIVEKKSDRVVGVTSHREGEGKKGLGIDIGELEKIWKYVDSDRLVTVHIPPQKARYRGFIDLRAARLRTEMVIKFTPDPSFTGNRD
jgi:S1-C subfamily serine protease